MTVDTKRVLRFMPAAGALAAEPSEEQAIAMADVMTALADEVLAAEDRIKELILDAHAAGDFGRAEEIVRRWRREAPVDLLESLEGR